MRDGPWPCTLISPRCIIPRIRKWGKGNQRAAYHSHAAYFFFLFIKERSDTWVGMCDGRWETQWENWIGEKRRGWSAHWYWHRDVGALQGEVLNEKRTNGTIYEEEEKTKRGPESLLQMS